MMKWVFISLLLLGCTKSSGLDEVDDYFKKWNRLGITDYEFTLRVNCFCTSETVGPHKILVKKNSIVSVNGIPYDPNTHFSVKTIEQLFTYIQKTLAEKPVQKTLAFDAQYFYPTNVYFDMSEMIADEEIGYIVTDFKPL
ncbi:MAG: hypothetical protein RLZ76_1712 [Bacteroidota bacterium]